jgi:hypothetical protein
LAARKRIDLTPAAARLGTSVEALWLALGASLKMYLRSATGEPTWLAGANAMVGTPCRLMVSTAASKLSLDPPAMIALTFWSAA